MEAHLLLEEEAHQREHGAQDGARVDAGHGREAAGDGVLVEDGGALLQLEREVLPAHPAALRDHRHAAPAREGRRVTW